MRTSSTGMTRREMLGFTAAAAGTLLLAACGTNGTAGSGDGKDASDSGDASGSGALTFTDDLGNEVTVDDPQRVVVGMGSLADIWRDAGGTAVGLSDDAFKNFGFSADDAASIGDHTNLSIEKILALDPDFVILSGSADGDSSSKGPSQDQLKQSLEASGVAVAFFQVSTFDDYLRMLKTCTQITGRDDLYQTNGADVQARVNEAIKQYSVADTAPVVLVMNASSKGASAQKPDHMASQMVKALGAKLLTEENPSLLSDFSMEAVAELDPSYIFVLPAAKDDATAQRNYEQAVESNPAWAGIGAVAAGHVTVLDIKHFFRKPNAEWDQAYVTLGKALATL